MVVKNPPMYRVVPENERARTVLFAFGSQSCSVPEVSMQAALLLVAPPMVVKSPPM